MVDPTVLRQLPLLRGVSDRGIAALAERSVLRRFAPGQVLWTAGAEPRGLFLVVEGAVRVLTIAGGRQHLVHTEGPGGTLGEVPLFAGGGYPATAVAADPTTCVVVSRDALSAAMALDPEIAWVFLARLSARVRTLVERLDRLAMLNVPARLAAYLIDRAAGGRIAALDGPHWRVAEELGTVREVVVRAFRDLRAAGLIRPAGARRWEIVDEPELRRLARNE